MIAFIMYMTALILSLTALIWYLSLLVSQHTVPVVPIDDMCVLEQLLLDFKVEVLCIIFINNDLDG